MKHNGSADKFEFVRCGASCTDFTIFNQGHQSLLTQHFLEDGLDCSADPTPCAHSYSSQHEEPSIL